jgi:serpin B
MRFKTKPQHGKYLCTAILLLLLTVPVLQGFDTEIPAFSKRINEFSVDVLRYQAQSSQAQKNMIVSPQSIFHGLAMSYIASGGTTRQELATVLHFPDDDEQLLEDVSSLRQTLHTATRHEKVDVAMANSTWLDSTYADFQTEYIDMVEQTFDGPVRPVRFENKNQIAEKINLWISEKTRGRIQKSVAPEDFESKSKPGIIDEPGLVIINALYFNAAWGSKFDEHATTARPFHVDTATTEDVLMMHQQSLLLYAEDKDVKFLEIPYIDGDFAMYLILPKYILRVSELTGCISEDRIATLKRSASIHKVDVLFPKFTMQSHLDVKDALMAMGVQSAFDNKSADFDKMIVKKIQAFRIYISRIYHDAWIEVDEDGTEAAAATTTVHHSFGCSAPPRPLPAEFHADRPFLFFIAHNQSRSILFCGWISDPGELR